MRYPDFLHEKGRIGIIAPSFGATTAPYDSRFAEAVRKFSSMGYEAVEGPNCHIGTGTGRSNTAQKCGEEINDFFLNDKSDVLISCGGGELMCEDLPYVDFLKISSAMPKWYMGYSDNTNLTFLLPTLCDTAAIYAPCVSDFGMEPWHPAICDAFDLLKGKKFSFSNYDGWESGWPERDTNPLAPYNITEPYKQILAGNAAGTAEFSGRLLGGCLDCLSNLVGTRFDRVKDFNEKYKGDGVIWFMEACDLNCMSIRRALWQLEAAGWFENVKGFIIGRSLHYDDSFGGFTPIDAYTGILSKYNVPVVLDVDLGHLSPMIPFVSGGYAKVKAKENSFNIEMILK